MNYSEMHDAEINRRVAWIVYPGDDAITPYSHRADVQVFHKNGCNTFKDWCNSWADAGPIINQHKIDIRFGEVDYCNIKCMAIGPAGVNGARLSCLHEKPLRAAMTVFLAMQEQK